MRAFVAANAPWELSFMGLKTFIVLFVVKGLGESVGTASAVIGVVAGAYVVASFGAGRLADSVGLHRLMHASLWTYGLGLLVGAGFSSLGPLLVGLPFVALAGAVVMTLPYEMLAQMTPAGAEGTLSGLFGFSRALGAILGPIVVGVSIDVLQPLFPATSGYGAMWLAIGAPILLSLPFLAAFRRESLSFASTSPRSRSTSSPSPPEPWRLAPPARLALAVLEDAGWPHSRSGSGLRAWVTHPRNHERTT